MGRGPETMTPEEAFAEFVEQREVFTLLAPFWTGDFEVTLSKGATLFGSDEAPKLTVHIQRKGDTTMVGGMSPLTGRGEGYTLVDAARMAVQTYNESLKEEQRKIVERHKAMKAAEDARRREALAKIQQHGPSHLANADILFKRGKR